MTALIPRRLSRFTVAAPLLLLSSGVVSFATAAEIVVETVAPPANPATPTRHGVTREDFQRIAATIPGVQQVIPVRAMPSRAVYGDRELPLQLIGTVAEYGDLVGMAIEQGRFLMPKDVDGRNNVVVVDALTARRLFPDGQAIGKNIRIANHYFLIVGVVRLGQEALREKRKTSREGTAFVPLTTMRSRYGDTVLRSRDGSIQMERYELSRIRVAVKTATNVNQTVSVIQSLMNEYHEKQDYSVRTVETSARK